MDELLEQFLIEGRELTQAAVDDLMALERDPDDVGLIDRAFRAVHTLKGSVGLFDLAPMGEALHAAEDLLGALRAGTLRADAANIDDLLACLSQGEQWIARLERGVALDDGDTATGARLAAALRAHLEAGPPTGAGETADTAARTNDDTGWARTLAERHGSGRRLVAARYRPDPQSYFQGVDPLAVIAATPGLVALDYGLADPDADADDPYTCNLIFSLLSEAPEADLRAVFRLVADQVSIVTVGGEAEPAAAAPEAAARTLRVDATRLDGLADLIDELVVAKNALGLLAAGGADAGAPALAAGLTRSHAVIERLTAGLHAGVMRMRLTPFAPVFRRLPPLVRETAARLGKAVDLVIEGQEVEADKSVVDGIHEPLLHLVRNALDHGVETPAERLAAGKSERATLNLRAVRQGDEVVVSLADDGRGVDPAAIRRTALARGLRDAAALEAMSDQAAVELIFAPGFSTAGSVSDLSGRGVGMDAVRDAVLRLGGRVTLDNRPGLGLRIDIALPLTLVLSQILVLRCGGELMGAPIETVRETVMVPRDRVVPVRQGRAFVLREQAVPLVSTAGLLGLAETDTGAGSLRVLVADCAGEPVGFIVDAIVDRMSVLLRPMSGLLSAAPGVAGTTLMGDGRVLMVLDLPELIR